MAALSNGQTIISNYLKSDDTNYMLDALNKLGVIFRRDENSLLIEGINHKFPASECTNCTQINSQSAYEDDEMVVAYFGAGCFWHA